MSNPNAQGAGGSVEAPRTTATSTGRSAAIVGALLCTAFLLVAAWRMWPHMLDDGYICLQYARNLVNGDGFVYQSGERVDGQSNTLWVLLLAAGGSTGADWVVVAKVLGLAIAMGTLAVTIMILLTILSEQSSSRSAFATSLGAALLVSSPGFAFYAVTGLGTTLTALLVVLGVGLHLIDLQRSEEPTSVRCYFPLAVLCLTRPEAPLVLALVHGHRLWLARRTPRLRRELTFGGLAWLPLAALLLFRWSYFGSPLPNTFYAKPGTSPGDLGSAIRVLGGLAAEFGTLSWLTFLFLGAAAVTRSKLSTATRFTLVVIGAYLAFALYTGGDWMPHGRFIQPIMPLIAIVAAIGLVRLAGAARQLGTWMLVATLGTQVFFSFSFWSDLDGNSAYDHALSSRNNVSMGRWLGENVDSRATLLTDEIGALGFYSGMHILDQWGLVDSEVARLFHARRFNPYTTPPESALRTEVQDHLAELLLARSPDFVAIDYRAPIGPGELPDPRWVMPITMAELFERMGDRYEYRRAFVLAQSPPKAFLLYERTDRDPNR